MRAAAADARSQRSKFPGEGQCVQRRGHEARAGQARRDPPIDRNPPSLPMLSTLLLLPMLRIEAKLPILRSDAALAIDSRLEALIRLHQLL